MNELSVGLWLRRERERRGVTVKQIADQTKVAAPLLEGLEAGDLSRWPGGIYRRAFVKAYAAALSLDADEVVKRFEAEQPPDADDPLPQAGAASQAPPQPPPPATLSRRGSDRGMRGRLIGTSADLAVALVLGLGSAAAGSRLLWPVLFIALYYALGVLLTGTSPMVALLTDEGEPGPSIRPVPEDSAPAATPAETARMAQRVAQERRPGRRVSRAQRASKPPRPRVQ